MSHPCPFCLTAGPTRHARSAVARHERAGPAPCGVSLRAGLVLLAALLACWPALADPGPAPALAASATTAQIVAAQTPRATQSASAQRFAQRSANTYKSTELLFANGFEAGSEPASAQLQVWVTDTAGSSVPGVRVRADGLAAEVLTDAEGRAVVSAPAINGALLRLDRSGYLPQWRRLDLSVRAAASTPLRIGLVPRATAQRFDATQPVTLAGDNGARVMLPANAFVDAAGKPVSGEIDAFISPLDVSDANGLAAFPGGFQAIGEGDAPGSLLSYGLVDFAFEQAGRRLQLAVGRSALIDVPLYLPLALDGTPLQPAASIPLWSLNESDGIWRFEGEASVVSTPDSPTGLALRGEAGHFSWWNADVFVSVRGGPDFLPRTAFLRPRISCNVVGEPCPGAVVEGAWLDIRIAEAGLPRVGTSRWVSATGEPPLVDVPAGFSLALEASVADGFLAVAAISPSPLRADQAEQIIDVDILLSPRHLVNDGRFVPGERLRGRMESIGENHRYRFAGRGGLTFRLRGYPAANANAAPGISSDLGAAVQVLRGAEVLAEARFEASSVAEIDLLLPADDEYQVQFVAEGKVPGFYVATTVMNSASAAVPQALFVARDFSNMAGDFGVFTVDELGSYVELSQPQLLGCIGPRMGNSVSGSCQPSSPDNGTGERLRAEWLPPFARMLAPGRIAYLSETEQSGFSSLFTVEVDNPGLALTLSGPEVGGAEGFRVVDYRNAPALPDRVVYKVAGSAAPVASSSVTGPDNPGLLYAVEISQAEQRRQLPRASLDRWVTGWEMDALGRRLVYESQRFDPGGSGAPDHLYLVELDNPNAPARQVSGFDPDAGDRVQRFALSPDGRWLAYSVRLSGSPTRYEGFLVDLDAAIAAPQRISDPAHGRVRELRFASDSRSLVYRQASSSSQLDGGGVLYLVDLSDPKTPAPAVRLGSSSFGSFSFVIRPDRWRIAPGADRVVAWSDRQLREVEFAAPESDSLRVQLPSSAILGPHIQYAADQATLLLRFKPTAAEPWSLLRHPPGANRDGYEVLIESADLAFSTSGVLQFALAANGSSVLAAADIGNGSRHRILQITLGAQPLASTLVAEDDGDRSLLLERPDSSPRLSFGSLSEP